MVKVRMTVMILSGVLSLASPVPRSELVSFDDCFKMQAVEEDIIEDLMVWGMELPEEEDSKSEIEQAKILEEVYTPDIFMRDGVKHWGDWRWTWYSERVLPGGALNIPGRHTDESGYVCDEGGYICLASGRLKRGTIVDTPFGKEGKVYDSGCAANTLDVYVNW